MSSNNIVFLTNIFMSDINTDVDINNESSSKSYVLKQIDNNTDYVKDSIKKLLDEIMSKKVCEEKTDNDRYNIIQYDKIPYAFTDKASWPSTCNLLCWFCTRTINTRPIFIPKNIEPAIISSDGSDTKINPESEFTCNTKGVFCTYNCAQAYINSDRSLTFSEHQNQTNMLLYVMHKLDTQMFDYIEPTIDPRLLLKCYGGKYTEHQYHQYIEQLKLKNTYKS